MRSFRKVGENKIVSLEYEWKLGRDEKELGINIYFDPYLLTSDFENVLPHIIEQEIKNIVSFSHSFSCF